MTGPIPRLDRRLLVLLSVAVVPGMGAFALGYARPGAACFFFAIHLLLLWQVLRRHREGFTAVTLAALPVLLIIRGAFGFHNTLLVDLAVAFAWNAIVLWGELRKSATLCGLVLVAGVYWWLTCLNLGGYAGNLRAVEFAFCTVCVWSLGRNHAMLGTMLAGLSISVFAVAAGLLRYGDRLGMAQVGDVTVGNPILLGMPAALIFLLCLAGRGRYLWLERSRWRIVVATASGVLVFLSTSRASWLVAACGVLVVLLLDRDGRRAALPALGLLAIGLLVVASTGFGETADRYLDRLISPDVSLVKKTTGRSQQWAAFPSVFATSPLWGVGPGLGRSASSQYSHQNIVWHSLYLHIGAETGTIGLLLLAALVVSLFRSARRHRARTRDCVPLIALICYLLIGLSVIAIDPIGGLFVGLAATAGSNPGLRLARLCRVVEHPTPEQLRHAIEVRVRCAS